MYQFIVNPSAGTGRGYHIWKKLERQLENDSLEYRVFFTEGQGEAAQIAKRLTAEKEDAKIIVVVGGEGTYNEVLNGLSFKGMLTVGYIPAGFRNALSKGFQSYRKVSRQAKRVLHPKYYRILDYGVITGGSMEISSRRFAGRCGIGLDADICKDVSNSGIRRQFSRLRMASVLNFLIGLKRLISAKPTKGYILLDGAQKVEFNHIYFISFLVGSRSRNEGGRKRRLKANEGVDSGMLTVSVASTSGKGKMVPILMDFIMGVGKKERGVRVFKCREAQVHLNRPLAVHVDGEDCEQQQDFEARCIPGKVRMIGM